MLSKSERNDGEGNNSKTKLIVNTSDFSAQDLSNYLDFSMEIERKEKLRQTKNSSLLSPSHQSHQYSAFGLKANKTREEIYECSYLEDDEFLTALEHQNSYVARSPTTTSGDNNNTEFSHNIRDLLKYFEKDNDATKTGQTSPIKRTKVATAVNTFKSKTFNLTRSPFSRRKTVPVTPIPNSSGLNIQDLRKKYEAVNIPSGEIIKNDHRKHTKQSNKSMVSQITKMFNSKIANFMRHDLNHGSNKYEPLNNEVSPEGKPITKPVIVPIAKNRLKMPRYRPQLLPSPVPSPRSRRKNPAKTNIIAAEDIFSQLSVKDKALLYTKFIEDMSKENIKFDNYEGLINEGVSSGNQSEGISKDVKMNQKAIKSFSGDIKDVLHEANVSAPMDASKNLLCIESDSERTQQSPTLSTVPLLSEEEKMREEQDLTRVSKLTVVLKSKKVERKKSKKSRLFKSFSKPLMRKSCNNRRQIFADVDVLEPALKRTNSQIRSSVKMDVFAPPRKIRRTQAERLVPKQLLKTLFYGWLNDKNGVDFDIKAIEDLKDIKNLQVPFYQQRLQDISMDRFLEDTIAKLETPEERFVTRDSFNIFEPLGAMGFHSEDEVSIKQSVIEITVPLEVKVPVKVKELKKETLPVTTQSSISAGDEKTHLEPLPPIPSQRSNFEHCQSSASSVRHSEPEDDIESRLSSLPKITSEESQGEQNNGMSNGRVIEEKDNDFVKPLKPPRKKKLRRCLAPKKDTSAPISNTLQTTDSDSDYKKELSTMNSLPTLMLKSKNKHTNQRQLRTVSKSNPLLTSQTTKPESSSTELNRLLMRNMNSPRRIKSRYTLTILSSPSNLESDAYFEPDIPHLSLRQTSRSCPSIAIPVDSVAETGILLRTTSTDLTLTETNKNNNESNRSCSRLMISYEDQGFETGSYDTESMHKRTQITSSSCSSSKQDMPLFIKLTNELEKCHQRRLSRAFSNRNTADNPSSFSTPMKKEIKTEKVENQSASAAYQRLSFSPISSIPSLKSRRSTSFYETDPRRSSIMMQVINEDRPWQNHDTGFSPSSLNSNQNVFFSENSVADITATASEAGKDQTEKSSVFWITAGDFCVSFDIYYNSVKRLRLLYDIFSQKSSETRELHFGIDDQKFCLIDPIEAEEISTRLPRAKGCSHYWFSTGDLAVPFSGKFMTPAKVKRLFNFVRESVAESGILRFGVDRFEFSHIPEFNYSDPKLSMESNYSILVGLQGASNGLEGRGKYSWPHSMNASPINSNGIKTSSLDHSEFDSDGCESSEMRLSSGSFFDGSNLTSPRISISDNLTTMSPEMFSLEYENEPLDQLFGDSNKNNINRDYVVSSGKNHKLQNGALKTNEMQQQNKITISQMLQIIQNQRKKLKSMEKCMRFSVGADHELMKFKDSPEYVRKLQELIAEINYIGLKTGFKNCSLQQLETFKFYLKRYAAICLASCTEHMEIIQEALKDKRSVQV